MPQLDLGLVIGPQGPQGPEGPAGPQGIQGPAGAPATINNVTALTLTAGDNVNLEQSGSTATLSVPTGAPGGVAGLGENGAVPVAQGGTGATTPQAALANLGAGVRPNLLVNGRLRVWQRYPDGYSGAPNRIYVPDRFQIQSSNSGIQTVLTKADDHGGIYNESGPSCAVRYYLEDQESYNGKTLTLSCLKQYPDGRRKILSSTKPVSGWTRSTDIFRYFDLGWIAAGERIFAYKLEEGEGQTLGYQDGTGAWRLLPQPDDDYQTQLAKCKYFFNRYNYVQGALIGLGFATNAQELGLVFQIPVMRTNPTISVSSLSDLKISQGGLSSGVSPIAIAGSYMDGEGNVNIALTVSGGLTPGAVYRVGLTGGYIDFSAEL